MSMVDMEWGRGGGRLQAYPSRNTATYSLSLFLSLSPDWMDDPPPHHVDLSRLVLDVGLEVTTRLPHMFCAERLCGLSVACHAAVVWPVLSAAARGKGM